MSQVALAALDFAVGIATNIVAFWWLASQSYERTRIVWTTITDTPVTSPADFANVFRPLR